MEKYEKVYNLMKSKPEGRVELTDPELVTLLGKNMYRIATYVSCIRRLGPKEPVSAIRNGRKVVAYQLDVLAPPAPAAETVPTDETPATDPTPTTV